MLISDLSSDVCSSCLPCFLGVFGVAPRLNGGQAFLGVNPAYLRSERGRNELRDLFGLPLAAPAYDPTKEFNANEATYAAYLEGIYEIPIGALTLDGVVGTRVVKTDRTISGFERVEGSDARSEEHTPELQSLMRTSYAVFCL